MKQDAPLFPIRGQKLGADDAPSPLSLVVGSAMASLVACWMCIDSSLWPHFDLAHPSSILVVRQEMMKTRSCSAVSLLGMPPRQPLILEFTRPGKSVSLVTLATTFSSCSWLLVMFSLEWVECKTWQLNSYWHVHNFYSNLDNWAGFCSEKSLPPNRIESEISNTFSRSLSWHQSKEVMEKSKLLLDCQAFSSCICLVV